MIGRIFGGLARQAAFAASCLLPLLLSVTPPQAWAQSNSIESVVSAQQGRTTVLRIRMKTPPPAVPPSFSVINPPRVAIDLDDTDSRLSSGRVEFAQGEVRSLNVARAGGRARVVLNLRRPASHSVTVAGNELLVTLEPVEANATGESGGGYAFAKDPNGGRHEIRSIDFRRGRDGEGRVVVDLSDAQTGVDIRQQGQSIVVDFLKSGLPERLQRRFDVGDFGTPVRTMRAIQQGENTRLVIEPSGQWEHAAYQSDRQFVVEVRPTRPDPNRNGAGAAVGGYTGEKLSLNFQNIEIRALLQVIADFTNLNIVTSDSVNGSLTLRLKDVPWDHALDIVLQSKGLDKRRNGNVIVVAPREELAAREKLALEARQQIAEIEPLRTEVFQLNYQKAEALGKLLTDDKQRVLSKRGSAVVDARTNKIFVQDTVAYLEDVRKMIAQVDVAVRQVLIEARIVEADDRFSMNLGAKLGYNDLRSTIARTGTQIDPVTGQAVAVNVPVYGAGSPFLGQYTTVSGNLSGVADLSSQMGTTLSGTSLPGLGQPTAIANTNFVNLPAAGINGVSPASFALSLFGASLTRFVNLEISALEADQRGKVVSSPRVLTADQGKAVIEQGTELPYQAATSSGATSIQFRKANLRLEVVPQITPEGNVILDVAVNRDAVGQLTTAGFAIDTRHVKTQVLVENGGTVVIGGIYEQFERNRVNKVPVLGDIPYLGNLFKNTQRTNDRTELLVFLTPRVVTDAPTGAR